MMWEERRLRVFENRVLRRVFGSKRDEVTREWRKLHNEELTDLYSSTNNILVIKSIGMRWTVHVARMGEEERCIQDFGRETEGKRPFGKPRLRWEDNIKVDLQEVGCGVMNWIELAQDKDG